MSTHAEREKNLRGLRETHADLAERLTTEEVGTRSYELYADLHHHLGRVIEISEEILILEGKAAS